jgi:5-methylcytosine-specific restriction endonuclease McrA
MVHVLTPPGIDSVALIDEVVAERQNGMNKGFFNGMAAEWRQRVQAYLDNQGSPVTVENWAAVEPRKGTLLNLYKNPAEGSAQGNALAQLRAHKLTICPACGEAGRPNTLDHFLPKGAYPHFAIVPHNLFPMCDACQSAKLEKTGDAEDPKFFIHPYYDRFSTPKLVSLTISPPFATPEFKLNANPALLEHEQKLVSRHLVELEVTTRFTDYFREQYRRILRLAAKIRESDRDVAATFEYFQYDANAISNNSWDCIVYDAVLSNGDLIQYLSAGELPPLL